jgi:NhaP-type Na+/H+ or K+/H+ antiporter
MNKIQKVMLIGSIIGGLLGAGIGYLLMIVPADIEADQEPDPITAGELITLTGAAATVIRRLDELRYKL